ncbi:MAG: hypothetical protein M3495_04975 [Pseudomonadota bacterium]|nr:hypothetical protein [Gammaproteobacteria bacterium]MDQ3580996.1 hypothetical protein [Pseudomonadota bacterium]
MKRKLMTMVATTCLSLTGVFGQTVQAGAFPAASCQPGYFQVGARLCMSGTRGPNSFEGAMAFCQDSKSRVADYSDWFYRITRFGGALPVGFWIGTHTADNRALFINRSDIGDFDGETSRFDSRFFVCAHDDNF